MTIAAVVALVLLLAGIRFWHPPRPALGHVGGKLSPPPKENRGVSSQASPEARHFVEPIAFTSV